MSKKTKKITKKKPGLHHPQPLAGLRLGILGGGQLARMLALAAHPLGIKPQIFSASVEDPAALVTAYHQQGRPEKAEDLEAFLKTCDVVTFESEFMDASLLADLSEKTEIPLFPAPSMMGLWQDRWTQKELLQRYKIPTAPFIKVDHWTDLNKHNLGSGKVVLKQRRFGYDGYGTFFLDPKKDENQWQEIQSKTTSGFIAEKLIPFKRELALILARDQKGSIVDFPLVESKQTLARCDWVKGPLQHPEEPRLRRALKKMIQKENYVGVIAFELFDTGSQLLVNEVAPRVHNSGHYSQDALTLDQFTAHVMAVCGYSLPQTHVLSPFAMVNLLGESEAQMEWPSNLFNKETRGVLHWYQKKDNRPHRKMGHINILAKTSSLALKQAIQIRKKVKR